MPATSPIVQKIAYTQVGVSKVKLKATQSCPTPCDPVDCSPPGSSVHGILRARTMEWDLSNPETEPASPALQADSLPSGPPGKPQE